MILLLRIVVLLLAASLASGCGSGAAGDRVAMLEVVGAEVQQTADAVVLDVRLRYQFGEAVLEAMRHSVPVTLLVEARIVNRSSRPWLEVVLQTQRLYRLRYHALSRQYLLEDMTSGEQTIFPSYLALQDALARPPGLRLADDLSLPEGRLQGSVRARLYIEDLPPAMRLSAYLSPQWRLRSQWYVWTLES
jgi:hypothetical protein